MEKEVLISREEIEASVRKLAENLSHEYEGREVVFIGILKGSYIFMADLLRHVSVPHEIDFMRVASYGSGTISSGEITITKDIESSIEGKDVVVIEDIIDTGITLSFLKERLMKDKPHSLRICALLDKKDRRQVAIDADYVGFTIPDKFVVGYGLDYDEKFRSLPEIYVIKQ